MPLTGCDIDLIAKVTNHMSLIGDYTLTPGFIPNVWNLDSSAM